MTTPTEQQPGVLLHNGQVLMPGTAQLYDPAAGKWATTGSMNVARTVGFTATVLQNGQVLVAGGVEAGVNMTVTSGAELYNPATGTWTPTGSMTTARFGHTATLLPNGQVLAAGGALFAGSSAELYDPAAGTWATTGSMTSPHDGALAGLLPNGQVLVVCGVDDPGVPPCATDLYNPATGTWTFDGIAGASATRNYSLVLLHNGQVLISGGENGTYPAKETITTTANLFDPATGNSTATGSMTAPREFHALIVLQDGQVLAAGGETQNKKGQPSPTASAELYAP